eukprot:TRINITY_DN187_c0_g1_i2.p1 TRINITY_DN187_c0_g1~~TRINITY_DN187_c0_g1_i2.p1  ORF type:complete len:347 (-),score=68.91 TRINITY_DN187_c0_g1_i2:29-1069(-)
MLDFSAIVLWILEQAETAAATLAAGTGAAAGVGAGALGALGAVALGLSGPLLVAGLTAAAIGAALTGRLVVERTIGNSPHETVAALGAEFYKVILQEEPFKSAKVADITRTYRWAPFCAIRLDDSMLTVLLLLSQFRMRSVPVLGNGEATLGNLITQSGVIAGLASCRGVDWFDFITSKSLEQLGLPRMAPSEVVTVDAEALVLEAFFLMRTKNVGGLPVTDGPGRRLVANISVRDVQYLLLRTDLFAQRKELTVRKFLDIVTAVALHPSANSPTPIDPITCKRIDNLNDVIDKLSLNRIHRIHVVDDENCVQGVVTLRDIIGCFVTEPKDYFKDFMGGLLENEGI